MAEGRIIVAAMYPSFFEHMCVTGRLLSQFRMFLFLAYIQPGLVAWIFPSLNDSERICPWPCIVFRSHREACNFIFKPGFFEVASESV